MGTESGGSAWWTPAPCGVGAEAAVRCFMGCSSQVGSSAGVEGPSQGEKTFGRVAGSQPKSDASVWGRGSGVREGRAPQTGSCGVVAEAEESSGEGQGLKIHLEK